MIARAVAGSTNPPDASTACATCGTGVPATTAPPTTTSAGALVEDGWAAPGTRGRMTNGGVIALTSTRTQRACAIAG
jgi:hypothetical protein